jgi:hypothetical protein
MHPNVQTSVTISTWDIYFSKAARSSAGVCATPMKAIELAGGSDANPHHSNRRRRITTINAGNNGIRWF